MTTTTQSPPVGILEYVDPAQIVLETNVRPSAPLTDEFIATIREHGVLQPVRGRRDDTGSVIVRAGQRRVLAAREAGLTAIPVFVVDSTEHTVERIVEQIVENDQREALTDTERTAAWQQLALEGLTPAVIAKRTGTKTARVKTGLKVAGNELAATAIAAHQLTLDQAAALVEFEADEGTVAELIAIAVETPGQFDHAVQRARDDQARARAREATEQDLAAQGYTILDREPGYQDTTHTRITELVDSDGNLVTAEQIAGLDGAAALVRVYYGDDVHVTYFLADPKAHGFAPRFGGGQSGPMTDEEKAERREVIANNKAWDAAQTVRREWLTQFFGRRTLPKDAPRVIATALAADRTVVAKGLDGGNKLAHDLLGVAQDSGWGADRLAGFVHTHPAKAAHVTLAIVLGGLEGSTGRHSWRNPDRRTGGYLTTLEAWGYTLCDVEQIVVAHTQTHEVDGVEVDDETEVGEAPEESTADGVEVEPAV
ncbi:ParB/RepB/Spo0J family partition protein [Microbacterium sp. HA-8]|uniref:ParB/RepB/Spo0J family partition protein n=1 Tax=unclassified Microbacterium TaxID=2609290 RepID=UPI000C2BE25E|nr:ParB/RepB/Spo0J family partition protein [Microbacterium sp. BR1]